MIFLKERKNGKHIVLEVKGELDLYNATELKTEATKVIDKMDGNSMVLDFDGVSYIDSSGLGVIIQIKNLLKEKGKTIAFLNIRESIIKVFKFMRFDKNLKIYSCEEELSSDN